MSSDNALFVQKRQDGKFACQHGFMSSDELPDPEKAPLDDIYDTLDRLIMANHARANDTEYGFQFYLEQAIQDDDIYKASSFDHSWMDKDE